MKLILSVKKRQTARHCSEGNSSKLNADRRSGINGGLRPSNRLIVDRGVVRCRLLPTEAARHGGLPHRVELRARSERVDRTVDCAQQPRERQIVEQEAGNAVLNGIGQPAGSVGDRQRTEPQGVHLAQSAWLKARGHEQKIAPGKHASRTAFVKSDLHADITGIAQRQVLQFGFEPALSAPRDDNLAAFANNGFGGLDGQIDTLLMHEARHDGEQRATRNREAESVSDMLGVAVLAFPVIDVEGLARWASVLGSQLSSIPFKIPVS